MTLTPEQFDLTQKRIVEHQHERYEVDIQLNREIVLNNFIVFPNVLRPEITSGLYFAKYLSGESEIFKNKSVLDMGCGSGIQGVVAGLSGANKIVFSDIAEAAVENTKENVDKFNIKEKSFVIQGDLFREINGQFDIILFNHPFFAESPNKEIPFTIAMYDNGSLIHRFLDEAKDYLNEGGFILMPFFHFAGDVNNPEKQALAHGYSVEVEHEMELNDENIQKGQFSVYRLRPLENQ